jgi:hypothetical protein
MYKKALMNTRKFLDEGFSEETPSPSKSFIPPRQQGLQDKQYDPMQFLKNGLQRIREASRAHIEETKVATPKVSSTAKNPVVDKEKAPIAEVAPVNVGKSKSLIERKPSSGAPFLSLIDRHEGGGQYDTLLGFSNRKEFKDVDVTQMTLEEIDQFAKTRYAAWSKDWKRKNNHGDASVPSTPMGRYQFVNTTLQAQARKMGLDPKTTKFTPEVQDAMFESYLKSRLARADTEEGKVKQLRAAWEGFRKVPSETLVRAIRNLERA